MIKIEICYARILIIKFLIIITCLFFINSCSSFYLQNKKDAFFFNSIHLDFQRDNELYKLIEIKLREKEPNILIEKDPKKAVVTLKIIKNWKTSKEIFFNINGNPTMYEISLYYVFQLIDNKTGKNILLKPIISSSQKISYENLISQMNIDQLSSIYNFLQNEIIKSLILQISSQRTSLSFNN
ncbi:putative lipoprotein [Candidatus Kinetoplastibacterium desouzaii TCC079E]|uniref:Putative lipoprotein n=1 Tax=Candidatus Kinetoplastidibacterium desouzai TCC079E TaxID=1208919 RepID=M1L1V2_9PROT|nr:lipoprotein [Candidatus Kinetoplastibacterium desouzaii]AGF46728.1 putative lipoprotein [Candidatus Kinetoplastibacterium desouzaii TCC079E]